MSECARALGCDDARDALHRDAHENAGDHDRRASDASDEVVEPLACSLAIALPRASIAVVGAERLPGEPALLAPAISRLVRRLSWGGDGRRGVARIEVGAGALAGATVLVTADGGQVSVEVDLPAGATADAWAKRLGTALEARGVRVTGIDIR